MPWMYVPKTPKDLLGDIFAELTDVFADLDDLRATDDPVLFVLLREALVVRCRELELEWAEWGRLHTPTTSPTVSETALGTDIYIDPRICCRKLAEIIPIFVNEYAGGFGIHATVAASIMALLYLEEVDGGSMSAEARVIYAALSKNEKGRTTQYFVDNFRRRFSALGIRLFAPLLI